MYLFTLYKYFQNMLMLSGRLIRYYCTMHFLFLPSKVLGSIVSSMLMNYADSFPSCPSPSPIYLAFFISFGFPCMNPR